MSRHKLLFTVGVLLVVVLLALLVYLPRGGEKLVASGVLSVSKNSAADSFSYTGVSVNQSMDVGCNIPASMKIICQDLSDEGSINVYINDESYATGTVEGEGEVLLSSGCGCSTVCICEIKIGDNNIRIASSDFAGQIKYEIYVKS
jgi:hypothetical protein